MRIAELPKIAAAGVMGEALRTLTAQTISNAQIAKAKGTGTSGETQAEALVVFFTAALAAADALTTPA